MVMRVAAPSSSQSALPVSVSGKRDRISASAVVNSSGEQDAGQRGGARRVQRPTRAGLLSDMRASLRRRRAAVSTTVSAQRRRSDRLCATRLARTSSEAGNDQENAHDRCGSIHHHSAPAPSDFEGRRAFGRAARVRTPRSSHAEWSPPDDRADPVSLLEEQAESRVPALVPVRHGRMMVSPFTFYRGAALLMAADLATTPNSGLTVQLCGDAHLSNFGLFGSAERRLAFDINDFDETHPGTVRVGRQAARGELRDRRTPPRVHRRGAARDARCGRSRIPRADAALGRAVGPRCVVRLARRREGAVLAARREGRRSAPRSGRSRASTRSSPRR